MKAAGRRALARCRRLYCTHPYVYSDRNMRATYGKVPPAIPSTAGGPEVTKVANGMEVVTQDNGDATSLIAFYVDAGCLYESEATAGTAHYVSEMLYKSNLVSSDYHQFKTFQHSAANYWTGIVAKRYIAAKVECRRDLVPNLLAHMCEAMFIPRFASHELNNVRELVENKAATYDHDSVAYVRAKMSEVGFQGSPYGNSVVCPAYNVDKLQSTDLVNWWSSTFIPSRIKLAGVNVSQQELLDAYAASEWSACNAAGPSHNNTLSLPATPSADGYVGGEMRKFVRMTDKFSTQRHYNDVVIGYGRRAAGRQNTKNLATMLVASAAVGPAQPFYEHFDDAGVVGGVIRVRPGDADGATRALVAAVDGVGKLSADGLAAAKKRAATCFLECVDSREGLSDWLVLSGGTTVDEMVSAISSIGEADVKRASDFMLGAPPTLCAYGDLSSTPSLGTL